MSVQHTPGPLKTERAKRPDNTGGYDYAVSDKDNLIVAECFEHVGYAGGGERQYIILPAAENAALIAEAFNVATETGLRPRQIADDLRLCLRDMTDLKARRTELLDGCNALDGLLTLILARDDLPPGLRDSIENNHRRQEARAAIAKATGAA